MLHFKQDRLLNGQRVILREYRSAWGRGWEIVANLGWT
jgi:hypothetical protein